jgi:tetratricopeptide (TPR) repeat protein
MSLRKRATERCACLAVLVASANIYAQIDVGITHFESLIKAQKYSEVSAPLEAYIDAHPDSWQALYQLAYVDFRLHRIHESVTLVCKSLVLNPKFAESHKLLAYDLNILGRQDFAIQELHKSLLYDSDSVETNYELGRIYYEQGAYLPAIKYLEKAKSLNPRSVRIYHNLGLAYSAVGKDDKAVESFEQGLRLNAQETKPSAWPLIDYAAYFNLRNEFEKARDMLLQAVRIDNQWDQEFDELAKAYRGLGQTTEAISALKQAIALNPRKAEYHYVLAQLYKQTHQLTEAKQQLAEFERQKSPQTR